MKLFETQLDGGEIITEYELAINNAGSSTQWTKIATYDGFALTHTLIVEADPISTGKIYKFKYRAANLYGQSDWSEELNAAVSSNPPKAARVR